MRAELHTHTLLSDGELLPIELARRAFVKGTKYLAFTDHASLSNLERVISEGRRDAELAEEWGMKVLAGVEITHVPARRIDEVVSKARKLGAEIIVVHGETISEPVEKGTNYAAVMNPDVDILAHPGFITLEEAQAARDNGVALEITSRGSHCKTNGHVARMAQQAGALMVVNTDAHSPGDLIDLATATQIALAAGLSREEADRALIETPKAIIKREVAQLKVLKFGGSSLKTGECMRQVAEIIIAEKEKKAVVLSAVTGVTEMLVQFISRTRSEEDVDAFIKDITRLHTDLVKDALRTEKGQAKAMEELIAKLVKLERMLYGSCYIEEVNPRIRDYVQCFGERLSVIMLAALLNEMGSKARPVDADELGIITDGLYGTATVNMEATRSNIRPKLMKMLQDDVTPIITGFFGRAPEGSVTVFGRNGSDYSAAAVANAMGASSLEIWKDVDGFMSVDPKIVPSARPIPRLSYDEAAELAYFGAKVVHPMTMEPARSGNIEIRVKNVFRPEAPGTAIGGTRNVDKSIKSISCMKNLSLVKVFGEGTGYKLGVLADVASTMREAEINIYSVVTSLTCIALLVDKKDVAKAQKVLADSGATRVETHTNFALMCIVGEGLGHHKGLASRVFKAVAKEGVNVGLISAGASLVAYHFTVDEGDLEKATKAVHEELFGC